ncbi:MAG: anaerobic ribonucleoside-triphosphate reductase activating protein [Bacteroidales bacterium]|nr:anaerobic ribonucleoside-triphosphate reductase activating protein [Bacteroidales bacterium]
MALRVLDIARGTSVDGPGLRDSIYFAGCHHACEGCHNPQSWDMNGGKEMSDDEVMAILREDDFDVTFSGGDPMYRAAEVARLARRIKAELGKTIWCYTGFVFENIVMKADFRCLLETIDVLVDGPFVLAGRDISLRFRGSGNQRIIDVKQSLLTGKTVLMEQYM